VVQPFPATSRGVALEMERRRKERLMYATAPCPNCAHGVLSSSEGKLDQCGNTYLPTILWTCDTCGLERYEPATLARWRPVGSGDAMTPAGDSLIRRAA